MCLNLSKIQLFDNFNFKKSHLINGFDIIGDIAIVKINSTNRSQQFKIGHKILSQFSNINSVFLQQGRIFGKFRTKTLSYLAGENRTTTIYRESGCQFLIDVSKVYFSPRLSHERLRIAHLINSGENILNMFAGIGSFSIIIAKNQPNCKIIDIEINPDAHFLANENYKLNKVSNTVESILGDSSEIIKTQYSKHFSRILMPLPENSIDFLEDALSALKSPGGWIHLYMHVVSEKNDSVLSKATKKLNLLLDNRGIVTNSRIVKQIGPNNYQVVLDIDVDFS